MAHVIKGNLKIEGSSLTVNNVEVLTETAAQALQNKTIDADQNTITNIENADIKVGAAIDAAKLADGSVSNDEFQRLNGVTSNIQDQLDAKVDEALLNEHVLIGSGSNLAVAVDTATVGDIAASELNGLELKAGIIEDADINSAANITLSKLAPVSASRALVSDGAGIITASSVTNTELGYVSGVTSAIQTQLDGKQTKTLSQNYVLIGNASIEAEAVDTSALGDVEATVASGLQIKADSIVNADINSAAAIDLSKLAALTASRALQSSASGEIETSTVTNTELGYVSGVTSAIQTQLNAKLALAGGTMTGNIAMSGNKVTGLGAPSASADAATKAYVDSVAEGLKPKAAVRVATTTAGTLASSFENGDVVDGITLATNDRILIKNQAAPAENGIYVVQVSGAPVRATDFDSLSPIDEINGAMVAVQEGSANAGKVFVQTGTVATIGVDAINFVYFNSVSTLVGGDGITVSGSNISVDHDGEGLAFVANQLALELDGATLTKAAAGLKVADAGIDTQHLADSSVTELKLNVSVAGDGIAGGAGTALSVDHDSEGLTFVANQLALELDGTTLSKSASGLKVADNGIANGQISNSAAIARSKLASGSAHRVLVNDVSGVLSESAALTNGQLVIGSTGAAPVVAALTAGAGISITNGAGSISIAATSGSAGDIGETSFSAANNQVAPANVTGFAFANGVVRSFEALVSVYVNATTPYFAAHTLRGIQKGSTWEMTDTYTGDDTGVVFSITNAGQIQYTSTSEPGFVSSTVKFRAITTGV
jgi:hypothetical protein